MTPKSSTVGLKKPPYLLLCEAVFYVHCEKHTLIWDLYTTYLIIQVFTSLRNELEIRKNKSFLAFKTCRSFSERQLSVIVNNMFRNHFESTATTQVR